MKKRWRILTITSAVVATLVIAVVARYKCTDPYGSSHCCIIGMSSALEIYADDNQGNFPSGQSSPEASLSLLCRSNLLDPYTLRGMTVPEKTVRDILDGGGLLGPDTCGWHYTEGLTKADDSRLALLYCKQPLGHNGNKSKDGGRQVVFVNGTIDWISGDKWPSFLEEQRSLLSQRSERSKSGVPLVDATIELPDGRTIENVETHYVIQEGTGSTSGNLLRRKMLVWYEPMADTFHGEVTRTLSFSNLVSEPITVTFTNGIPDKTNAVFKMRVRDRR